MRNNNFTSINNVIEIIRKKHGKTVDITDEITCPVCKGRIKYAIHSNGDVRGKCQTADCNVSWVIKS